MKVLFIGLPGKEEPWLWTVRTRADSTAAWTTAIVPAARTHYTVAAGARDVVVTAIDRAGNESAPTRMRAP